MRRAALFLIALAMTGPAMSNSLTEDDLIVLPRITPGAFFFGNWSFDKDATTA